MQLLVPLSTLRLAPLLSHWRRALGLFPSRQALETSVLVKWSENAIIGYRCAVMNCPRYLHRRFCPARRLATRIRQFYKKMLASAIPRLEAWTIRITRYNRYNERRVNSTYRVRLRRLGWDLGQAPRTLSFKGINLWINKGPSGLNVFILVIRVPPGSAGYKAHKFSVHYTCSLIKLHLLS